MGIPPDPEYHNYCTLCFPEDYAPIDLYASVSGIQRTADALWWHPSAPNGIFKLSFSSEMACGYGKSVPEWGIVWYVLDGWSIFLITHALGEFGFLGQVHEECVFSFSSSTASPAPYVGGKCQIMWV